MQHMLDNCLGENRLPTGKEIATESGRIFGQLREFRSQLPETAADDAVGRSKGLEVIDGSDSDDTMSQAWREALVIHRFGDRLPDGASPRLRDLLEKRLNDLSSRLSSELDHADVLEWLTVSADQVDAAHGVTPTPQP